MMHGHATAADNARLLAFLALIETRTAYQIAMIIAGLPPTPMAPQ